MATADNLVVIYKELADAHERRNDRHESDPCGASTVSTQPHTTIDLHLFFRCGLGPVLGVRRIGEHQTSGLVPESLREDLRDEATEGMSHQEVWRWNASAFEQRAQFIRNAARGSRHRSGIAPSKSCAIVAADAGQPGEFWLHQRPTDRRCPERRIEYYGW